MKVIRAIRVLVFVSYHVRCFHGPHTVQLIAVDLGAVPIQVRPDDLLHLGVKGVRVQIVEHGAPAMSSISLVPWLAVVYLNQFITEIMWDVIVHFNPISRHIAWSFEGECYAKTDL